MYRVESLFFIFHMKFLVFFFLYSFFNVEYVKGENEPMVCTPLGTYIGYYNTSHGIAEYEAFEGIPYALPPVGDLRFEPPQRITERMAKPLNVQSKGPACLQYAYVPAYIDPIGEFKKRIKGSEDCLYLNIYVPPKAKNSSELFPVIFWINGGAFQFGSSDDATEHYIMDTNLILVTFNYRLGPLGFLSTNDDVVPGNMGLKDQNLALRWVSENIKYFGGDPKKITLAGVSAGAASTHYHYLSPMSAGLFSNGISISGTALNTWAQMEGSSLKVKELSSLVGCPTEDSRNVVNCLKKKPAQDIVKTVAHFQKFQYNPYSPFGPVVEKVKHGYFINRKPIEILTSGHSQKLPWITGVVSEEGLWTAADFIQNSSYLAMLNDKWSEIIPFLLDYNYTIPVERQCDVATKIRNEYFGFQKINNCTKRRIVDMMSHRQFFVDAELAARLQAKTSKVWFYYFSYKLGYSFSEFLSGTTEDLGVSHVDDALMYIQFDPYLRSKLTASDRLMREKYLKSLENFANKDYPLSGKSKWKTVDSDNEDIDYLHIYAPDNYKMESSNNFGNKQFWNSLNFNENKLHRL